MITLHQTNEPNRFDVSLCEKYPDDGVARIEGYVIRYPGGLWQAYLNGEKCHEHENPVEAAKFAIRDYEPRARLIIERTITKIETNIESTTSPLLRAAKTRMLVSLRTALRDGIF